MLRTRRRPTSSFTFGSRVATVAIITARKTRDSCMAWVDAAYRRTDLFGCVCQRVNALEPCAYKHCDRGLPPQPQQWQTIVRTVKKLANIIGVHMRIDMFATDDGTPVLGEFTPWHSNGKMHCHLRAISNATREAGAATRKNGLTGESRTVDVCALGRIWRDAGREEGGRHDPTPPSMLRGWGAIMYNEHAKCAAATRMLGVANGTQPPVQPTVSRTGGAGWFDKFAHH